MNVTLDIKEEDLKYTEKSFYHVYVFPNENNRYGIIDPLNTSQEDIHLGSDFRTYNNAVRALENTEFPSIDAAKNKENPLDGFLYTGRNYPITVKNYYFKSDDMKEEEESYIVFSYYEKKFFKNLSWTKVYPFKF